LTESKTETKPLPLPLNGIYLSVNPRNTTDLKLDYTRKIFGPLEMITTGQADLATIGKNFNGALYIGAGIRF